MYHCLEELVWLVLLIFIVKPRLSKPFDLNLNAVFLIDYAHKTEIKLVLSGIPDHGVGPRKEGATPKRGCLQGWLPFVYELNTLLLNVFIELLSL